jgi:hypothetical protein
MGSTQGVCVLERHYGDDDTTNYKKYMNPHLKYDPTLPRVTNIPCPNGDCVTNNHRQSSKATKTTTKKRDDGNEDLAADGDGSSPPRPPNDVIVVRYDDVNMKYLYHCSYCSTFWKTEQ